MLTASDFSAIRERAAKPTPAVARMRADDVAALQPLRTPAVLVDAADDWPLSRCATPDYFRRVHGAHPVRVAGQVCSLAQMLDLLERATPEDPGPYPCKFEIAKTFRELLPTVSPRFACSLPDRQHNRLIPQRLFAAVDNLEIFFGGAGGRFPYLHYDILHLHAWIVQLHGDKEFTLYAPDQEAFLYADPLRPWQSRIDNHHDPDLTRYPRLRDAVATKVVLHAGETLFLPAGWWHTARSLTFTISVAFDQLGVDNYAAFVGDVVAELRRNGQRYKARLLGAYLRALQPVLGLCEFFGANCRRQWGWR